MLELMAQTEMKVEQWMGQLPWYVDLLFYPEVSKARRSLASMRAMRDGYDSTREWYCGYAEEVNCLFDAAGSMAHAGYDLYGQLQPVPYIGAWVEAKVHSGLEAIASAAQAHAPGGLVPQGTASIPAYGSVAALIDSGRELRLAGLAAEAAEKTGVPMEEYRAVFTQPRPQPRGDYWLRSAAIGFAQALGGLLGAVFGYGPRPDPA